MLENWLRIPSRKRQYSFEKPSRRLTKQEGDAVDSLFCWLGDSFFFNHSGREWLFKLFSKIKKDHFLPPFLF
jgi:hypothetical protein